MSNLLLSIVCIELSILGRISQESQCPKRAISCKKRLQARGSQGKPWKLETRLNCVELAEKQDTGEGGLYTVPRQHMDHVI